MARSRGHGDRIQDQGLEGRLEESQALPEIAQEFDAAVSKFWTAIWKIVGWFLFAVFFLAGLVFFIRTSGILVAVFVDAYLDHMEWLGR